MNNKLHVIPLVGYLVAITQKEAETLLKSNPDIWKAGIRRGKGISRVRKEQGRKPKVRRLSEVITRKG